MKEGKEELEVTFEKEDLGFVNLLAGKLLESKGVKFAAASLDHPMKGNPILVIKAKEPKEELKKAVEKVSKELERLEDALKKAAK